MADGSQAGLVLLPAALVVAAAEGQFNGKAVFVDHASFFQNQSLDRLIGVTTSAAWHEQSQAVYGQIDFYDTPLAGQMAAVLDELLSDPTAAPDVGLSIVFYPEVEFTSEGVKLITHIKKVESVDLVFQPAADGRILQALSSAAVTAAVGAGLLRNLSAPESTHIHQPIEQTNLSRPALSIHKGDNHMEQQAEYTVTQPTEAPTETEAPSTSWQLAAEAATKAKAISAILAASGLPLASQAHIAQSQAIHNPADLTAAIESERAYLAALVEDQVIRIGSQAPRSPQVSGMRTSLDQIEIALEAMLNGTRPAGNVQPLTGIRELYHLLSGDYELTGMYQPERVQFANVNSSTMANMVANALNKIVVNEFIQYPHWWAPIVNEQDYATMQAIKWITLGGIGELPTVAEGASYTELTWDDSYETASFVKKGGYLGITIEAIDKDDTGRLRTAPRALAQAAWLTLSKSISYIFTQSSGVGPTLSDSNALFYARTAGTNVGSTALSITAWNATKLAMRKFTELNSGERVGALVAPKYLLVPPDLEVTALQVLGAEFDYLYALSNGQEAPPNVNAEGEGFSQRMMSARERVIVVDLWSDANDWAAVADPRLWPTIGIGYRYGRQPEIFSVATPTQGLMFTNDTMPIKTRFVYATGPMDWRGMYKHNVT